MNTILVLIKKDLLRDFKNPLGLILSLSLPLIITLLVAVIFGGNNAEQNIVVKVALLDNDDDFIGRSLKSMSQQGDAAKNLRISMVESVPEGITMLEERQVSAFIVLPENLTANLIDGATANIVIYENPAETVLPQVVFQGCELMAQVVSVALDLAQPEIKTVVDLFDAEEFPSSSTAAMLTFNVMQKANSLKPYFFPPLAQMKTIDAQEYVETHFDLSSEQENQP